MEEGAAIQEHRMMKNIFTGCDRKYGLLYTILH